MRDAGKSSISRLHQEKWTAGGEPRLSEDLDLIAGPESFGAMLESEGYLAFPSPRQPRPGKDKYLRGGFITRCHGSAALQQTSATLPVYDAIQLETPR